MKNISTLTILQAISFILISVSVSGQYSFSGKIEWSEAAIIEPNFKAPYYEGASFSLEFPFLPKYCETVVLSSGISPDYDLNFTSVSYQEAPREELRAIRMYGKLPSTPQLEYGVGQSRSINQLSVCFFPYIEENGVVKKVTAFEVSVEPRGMNSTENTPQYKSSTSAVASSVLNSDGWFKLAVGATGLYKITPSFLSDNQIASGSIAVSDLRVVGNGTGMLPEKNNEPRPDDLLEVPLKIFDLNNDGVFNNNDFAVFYAKGPHQWRYNENMGRFTHAVHVYRNQNFYFISVVNGAGARVDQAPVVPGAATAQVTDFDDYAFVEDENENLVGTGRDWYGDIFDFNLTYNYDFSFPNLNKSEPIWLRMRAVARASSSNTTLNATVGGNLVVQGSFNSYGTGDYSPYANPEVENGTFFSSTDNFIVQLTYDNSMNPAAVAWLDYLQINARRNLVFAGSPVFFRDSRSVGSGEIAEFQIAGANPALEVWDVTDHNNVEEMPLTLNNSVATFKNTANELREYVAFAGSGLPMPVFAGSVAKQNLHGLEAAEMIIITHPKFYSAAKRLGDFHVENDDISTHVVTTDQVYNEFASGGQDITAIRDFARMIYEKANTSGAEFNYLLLFGDASYDYKDQITGNSNYVPIYQGGGSLNLKSSSITDDYYAFLDPHEGGSISQLAGNIMDVGVGRIPSATVSAAESYVNKVIHYTTSDTRFGDWRNKVLLMADDVDDPSANAWEKMFVRDSEILEDIINNASEAFNVDKIYTDAYQQVSTTGSQAYPEASEDMFRKVQQGNLITNYIGHGGEIGLSSEKLLKLSHVNDWDNIDVMPLFITITCEFTRLDDPKRVSAGEQLALNPKGGSIGLLSTTRVVGAGPATNLNKAVFRTIFERPGNQPKTLGAIIRDAKNDGAIIDDQTKFKFSLIGDPAMRLAIPYYRIQTNSINGKPVSGGNLDTLKALSKVTVTGQVNDFGNQKLDNFNGVANVSVYDKASEKKTLVNDGVGPVMSFKHRNNLLYKGKVEVSNGDFKFEFIVPKDISYQYGTGKISLYAHNNITDAAGYNDSVIVGGYNNNAPEDKVGPVVKLFMNDESFVRGGITNKDPDLYAVISDSSGINTVGTGIGHDMVAILDERTDQAHVINEYYEADLNSYQKGSVRYPFYELEEGEHSLKLKVFDVHNNYSEAQTEFIVAESEEMALKRVLNYPNPFTTHTEFQFEHNRASEPLEVQVQVFTVSGKLVKTINQLVASQGNRVTGITWNGLDDYGDKIGKGVYVYRVKVRSQIDNAQTDKYEKLVILR